MIKLQNKGIELEKNKGFRAQVVYAAWAFLITKNVIVHILKQGKHRKESIVQ